MLKYHRAYTKHSKVVIHARNTLDIFGYANIYFDFATELRAILQQNILDIHFGFTNAHFQCDEFMFKAFKYIYFTFTQTTEVKMTVAYKIKNEFLISESYSLLLYKLHQHFKMQL